MLQRTALNKSFNIIFHRVSVSIIANMAHLTVKRTVPAYVRLSRKSGILDKITVQTDRLWDIIWLGLIFTRQHPSLMMRHPSFATYYDDIRCLDITRVPTCILTISYRISSPEWIAYCNPSFYYNTCFKYIVFLIRSSITGHRFADPDVIRRKYEPGT